MKYKKAYKENQQLKRVIEQQKNTINSMKKTADDKDSMNSWVWMNLKSMGIKYNSKTWTIPADVPETFIINGTTYKVIKEE